MSNVVKAPDNDGFVRILAPASIHPGVCCDVVDRGMKDTAFGMKHKVSIHFLINVNIPTGKWTHPHTGDIIEVHENIAGKPFMVSQTFNKTLGENSNLRNFLKKWRGKDFTKAELTGFDLDAVIGVPAALAVSHNESDGVWYANIEGCSKLPADWEVVTIPQDYVRMDDRDADETEPAQESTSVPMTGPAPNFPEDDESDLPF